MRCNFVLKRLLPGACMPQDLLYSSRKHFHLLLVTLHGGDTDGDSGVGQVAEGQVAGS